jgi:hypothetical protein
VFGALEYEGRREWVRVRVGKEIEGGREKYREGERRGERGVSERDSEGE